jgi:hypothetical protein
LPHVTEHGDAGTYGPSWQTRKTKYSHSYFILYLFKPSQGGDCWHICVAVLFPPHVLHGVLVFKYKHDRLRVWVPWPHVVLHDDHVDQLKYEQSIGGKKNKEIHFKKNQVNLTWTIIGYNQRLWSTICAIIYSHALICTTRRGSLPNISNL